MSRPDVQTPGGNRANAKTNSEEAPIVGEAPTIDKTYANLRARFALAGHSLVRSNPADGLVSYYAMRWGQIKPLRDLKAAEDFLHQVGGRS